MEDNPSHLNSNSFAILEMISKGLEKERVEVEEPMSDSKDLQLPEGNEIVVDKVNHENTKASSKHNKKPLQEIDNSKSKGKWAVNKKNSQNFVVKKQNESTNQGIQIRDRMITCAKTGHKIKKGDYKIAVNMDLHVMVRGNNKTNVITQSSDRAQLEFFQDPTKPYPHEPNVGDLPTAMEVIVETKYLSSGPMFD